ncbi:glycosyltransferase family 4 protein [Candidatus Bathyarchaeota archaeon]|nr:glycosyltransferase family 4 protein [Candidatus Bathyarchaeota archaeon]
MEPIGILCFSFPAFGLNIADVGITGGDRRFIEVAKRWTQMWVNLGILITDTGSALYEREGFKDVSLYQVKPPRLLAWTSRGSVGSPNLHVLVSYFLSPFISMFKIPKLPTYNVVYSQSDFLCDTLLALFCKKVLRMKWAAVTYHIIPTPFSRGGNLIMNILSFVSQQVSFSIFKKADLVMVCESEEGRRIKGILIKRGVKTKKISTVQVGVDFNHISSIAVEGEKEYDACHVAALSPIRGLNDLVPVWARVVRLRKNAKLVVFGKGTPEYERSLIEQVQNAGLQSNIEIAGYLTPDLLFRKMKQCRIFLSLIHETGWCLAMTEAMACGLPAVAYELPSHDIYPNGLVKVPFLDFGAVAKVIVELLDNHEKRNRLAKEAQKTASRYEVLKISKNELDLLRRILR